MPSDALKAWRSTALDRLAELEAVHAELTGTGPGRRWGTTQLNRSLHTALTAQFQYFCRHLHDEAVQVHVSQAIPGQKPVLQVLLTQGRKLDTGNPRKGTLGSDFARLGFDFIADLKSKGVQAERRLDALEELIDFRNAIGHGNETKIASLESTTSAASTKTSYQRYRQALNGLAGTMDKVVAESLAQILGVARPW